MNTFYTDLIIIGAGAAGLSAAIAAQEKIKNIIVISKSKPFLCGSTFVNINNKWGLTFADNDPDREYLEKRINDISRGTNVPELTRIVVYESDTAFEKLCSWGVEFKQDKQGNIQRVPPCFCTIPFAVIIKSCRQAGECIRRQLDAGRVQFLSHATARKIIVKSGKFAGIVAKHKQEEIKIVARAGILATGGNASTYTPHITEPGLTGDGYKLLKDVGLELANMHFMQNVWEDVSVPSKRFPLSYLCDRKYYFRLPHGVTVDMDVISETLLDQRRTHVPISNLQEDRAVDNLIINQSEKKPVEVINRLTGRCEYRIQPFAQASNGGIITGKHGETPIPGLFAAGEIATGMHGGDRVGGMMITNCLVFGTRAGYAAGSMLSN